ncbi:hypothetical protein O1611_g9346 [Lasiodiplodia mahajangana]|uniref:Uncharacterized protein n=1 Tax=Lasiodiplodia mahajangana TaxID=1108764 RepID=A0ACC2J9W8_9PEZI|nr:hypothetical protein O1611_g9346 [Lasiodiplodia mahajangana]
MDFDTTALRPPPPGRTSNFTNPESRSYQLYILIAVLTALVVIVISLRLYTRLRITRSFGVDDCGHSSPRFSVLLWQPGGGVLGIHLWDVPISHYIEYLKGALAESILIRVTNTTIKIAFLLFYLRLFRPIAYVRYMVWIGIVVLVTFCLVFVALYTEACTLLPSEHGNWLAESFSNRCDDIAVDLIRAASYFSVITDFYILFIPLHQVCSLRLSTKRRFGLTLVFLTGLLAIGSGLANLIIRTDPKIFDPSDFTWTEVSVYATALVEINVGLLCHSLPVLSVLFASNFTGLSKTLSSWIRERRSPRQSPHQSPRQSGDESTPHIASANDFPEDRAPAPEKEAMGTVNYHRQVKSYSRPAGEGHGVFQA